REPPRPRAHHRRDARPRAAPQRPRRLPRDLPRHARLPRRRHPAGSERLAMAGGQERLLRRRIRSIQSTQKITRAQELIAASRIARAQARVAASQPYSETITEVVRDLAAVGGGGDSPLLNPRPEIRRVGHIVVAADRGLCGAYNSSVIRAAEASIREHAAASHEYSLV